MSASESYLLTTVTQQLTIYLGIPTLIAGVLGGLLNIIVFLSLKTFRQSPCAFFLTVMSIVNIGQLLTGLLSRILISGFNMDLTEMSVSFCKFRTYCLQVCTLISYSCMCLATADQFLATSLRLRWQQWFTLKRAYLWCAVFVVVWMFHGIPSLVFYNPVVSPRTGSVSCIITHTPFQQYHRYVNGLTLAGILPISITVLFGSLAYYNVRQIPYRIIPLVRRELDKQLPSMVLVQVLHNFIVIVPQIIVLIVIYCSSLTINSPNYVPLIFSNLVTGLVYYFYFAVSKSRRKFGSRSTCHSRVLSSSMYAYRNGSVSNWDTCSWASICNAVDLERPVSIK
jgi:hypothetical protein